MATAHHGMLRGVRVYLSGPMDFVASRAAEKRGGWRTRVGAYLRKKGAIVFDPWNKPDVRGLHDYGAEGEKTATERDQWTYKRTPQGAVKRAEMGEAFWPALHIDLRMVDTSDFIISYCPTSIYSVGTPNEIILARNEFKPVLLVSPHICFPELQELRKHLQKDRKGAGLLEALIKKVPIKENPKAIPSSWYMSLITGEYFFDGFGFEPYRKRFHWPEAEIDHNERKSKPIKPLLAFLDKLDQKLPRKWDSARRKFITDTDWLLWDLKKKDSGGSVGDRR